MKGMSVPQIRNRQRKGAEKRNECGPFRKEHMVQYTVELQVWVNDLGKGYKGPTFLENNRKQ